MLATHIPAPNSSTGRTMALLAVGLTIAVGIYSLIHLRHQIKLAKLQVDHHETNSDINKKSQA